jgi:glycosyltransferase involved in cell wall biosynthesis
MNRFLLSLLICHLPERANYLTRLLMHLPQEDSHYFTQFEVLVDDRPEEIVIDNDRGIYRTKKITIGEKRNALLQRAQGKYVAFIDDDDLITENYFPNVFEGIRKGVDCCSLKGIITDDGQNPRVFEHSIKYDRYQTVQRNGRDYYERFPNHLNVIRADIAKQFSFPEKNFSEDTEWATELHKSGMLKLEYEIQDVIYQYLYRSRK